MQFTHVGVFSDSRNVQKSVTRIKYLGPLPLPLCTALTAEWARDIPSKFTSGLSAGRPADAAPQRPAGARSSSSCRSSACYNSSCRSPGRRVPAGGACAACPPGTMGVLRAGGAAISLSRPAHPFTAKNPYYNSARFSMRTGGPAGRFAFADAAVPASGIGVFLRVPSCSASSRARPTHGGGGGSGPLGGGQGSLARGVARRGGEGRRGGRGRTRDGGGRRPWCSRAASPCCVYVCAMYAYTSCYIL